MGVRERKKQLEREIKQSKKRIRKELIKLYDLNLAPYRGYYEDVLKIKNLNL